MEGNRGARNSTPFSFKDKCMQIGDKYYYNHPEAGLVEVSKETHEMLTNIWDATKPKSDNIKGTIVVFGTGGEMSGKDYEKMFYDPERYK